MKSQHEKHEKSLKMSDTQTDREINAGDDFKPLEGRVVMITRARTQAAELAFELERYGARIVECPTIEIVPPESYELLDEAIRNLFGYDWIIFTSVNGVEHFLSRLKALSLDISELDEIRVCAIGEATTNRLRDAHVHVDLVPEKAQAEGVFGSLERYLGGRAEFENLNFLLPRAAVGRDFLPRSLEDAGARVDVVPAYRTVRPETTERARVEALLLGGGIDCITFTSSSTVKNFAQLFDTNDLGSLLEGVVTACIGEVTAQTASEFGLRAEVVPEASNIRALAHAVAQHLSRGR